MRGIIDTINESEIYESVDVKKAMDVLSSGEYSYECLEGELDIKADDGFTFTIDLNKITPDILKKIIK